ncbi:bZIP transcription factor 29-like [Nicotiana tomentosiformis]|uniref:bZIP transcription factor 29-like n=1 Tax=Nicotiana tomentosiformis TaxID=4098 RepID=UPI00051C4EA8|nr:bZIP transcription factor 18-like [Nicotiana tomentosiformis]XP_009598102.1 bZIP transcription factor 18-like [Nicotiana tomentosiformis]
MAQPNSKPHISHNFGVGASHTRSLSQPSIFSNNGLPPLSPFPHSESSLASANSSLKDTSMEEVDVSSRAPPFVSSFTRENTFRCSDSRPPKKGHRRSNSDVPLGLSAMIKSSPQLVAISGLGVLDGATLLGDPLRRKSGGEVVDKLSSYMNLENMEALNSSITEDKVKDSISSLTKLTGGNNSNKKAESVSKGTSIKRSADADITRSTRHFRSLSMDSAVGSFHYGDESPKLPTSLVNCPGKLSSSSSGNDNSDKINFDLGNGEFSEAEMRKIMADERLAEIVVSDPKRAKRILANRQSAARSKERKLCYISELEHKVQTLQTETTTLSTQVTILQKDFTELTSLNNELRFRLQAMEQQAQLRDALHKALTAEVHRLKFAMGELKKEGRLPNSSRAQQMPVKPNIFQMQRQSSEIQQFSVAKPNTATKASATPASA